MTGDSPEAGLMPAAVFATTHWSVIISAGEAESPLASEALSRLCRVYWYPLYTYVRRQGHSADEAQDLTQEFFARLLAKNFLRALDRRKGKFRSFLLASMEHFLAKEWRDARRLKRGGGRPAVSIDEADPETRYQIEPVETMTAEKIYERRWALTLLDQATRRMRAEFEAAGKRALFEELSVFLSGEKAGPGYAKVALRLDMTEGAVKVAVHRMRQRYGDLVRMEIANTVSSPEEVDEELRYLMSVLGGR